LRSIGIELVRKVVEAHVHGCFPGGENAVAQPPIHELVQLIGAANGVCSTQLLVSNEEVLQALLLTELSRSLEAFALLVVEDLHLVGAVDLLALAVWFKVVDALG
jgi:hypothetical protein